MISHYTNGTIIDYLAKEVKIFEQAYQIGHDISLLRDHIEQMVLTSKLNTQSKNILTEDELRLIHDLETCQDIKTTVVL